MCLSEYQKQEYHICNGTCYDHTVPCHGECQSPDFYMCNSGDQCYRYWDHCDNQEHCDDASDEGGACTARYVHFYRSVVFRGGRIYRGPKDSRAIRATNATSIVFIVTTRVI